MSHIPQDNCDVEYLLRKGKRVSATQLRTECLNKSQPKLLSQISCVLFDVRKSIADWDTIEWISYIISGGRTPEEFAVEGLSLLKPIKCFYSFRQFLSLISLLFRFAINS